MTGPETAGALRAEIDAVLADWAWLIDHREFDEVVELFTEDALFVTGPVELRGRQQIRQRYAARIGVRSTRHMYSGLRLTDVSVGSVRARSTWACYAANQLAPVDEAVLYLVADFDDALTRCADGRWRISERHIIPVFRDPSRAPITR
jgi:ketosteroid isomerase-like protein